MDEASTKSPSHVRGVLQIIAVALVLLLGVIALNWPITFANATPTPHATTQTTGAQTGSATSSAVADVAEKANPAVVTITNYQPLRNPFTGEAESGSAQPYGVGSGYIIDAQGHVVTNWHVIQGGTAFTVRLYDGSTLDATVVGYDQFQDVAVLQLDLSNGQEVPGVLSFGDSNTVRAGDEVVAIGTPYGEYPNYVTSGTVGAVDRALNAGDGYALPNLIQHSAPIYEGNSGGPLLNMNGEVIGMNVAKATQTSRLGLNIDDQGGIGFAIESNAIKGLVEEIITTGKVVRPYLGIDSRAIMSGQAIVGVQPGTPADEAGLRAGDVITGIDGQEIDNEHPFLNMLLFDHQPGDTVKLSVDRNGQEITITVTLGERPADTE
jgi:S1-C subfamily serine protease